MKYGEVSAAMGQPGGTAAGGQESHPYQIGEFVAIETISLSTALRRP